MTGNPIDHLPYKIIHVLLCHCATPFDTFFVNPFDTLLSSQNRSQNRTATCTTHTPHPKIKISRLQNHLPELLFSLFFLLIFVLLSGTFATFFAIFIFLFKSLNRLFSRLSVYFKASYCWFFFSFFKTKKPHLRGIPWNKVSGGFMVFLISFFYLSFCLTYALFPYFPASPLPFGSRKSSKEIA